MAPVGPLTCRLLPPKMAARTPATIAVTSPAPAPKPDVTPARAPAVALPKLLSAGLSVGGTLVGGLTKAEARDLVEQRFERPLTLVLPGMRQVTVAWA